MRPPNGSLAQVAEPLWLSRMRQDAPTSKALPHRGQTGNRGETARGAAATEQEPFDVHLQGSYHR